MCPGTCPKWDMVQKGHGLNGTWPKWDMSFLDHVHFGTCQFRYLLNNILGVILQLGSYFIISDLNQCDHVTKPKFQNFQILYFEALDDVITPFSSHKRQNSKIPKF